MITRQMPRKASNAEDIIHLVFHLPLSLIIYQIVLVRILVQYRFKVK